MKMRLCLRIDENLPVTLPEEVEFDGVHSPSKTMSEFYEVNDGGMPLVRETDTFDNFMESSLRLRKILLE